jgi:hypothetical protein
MTSTCQRRRSAYRAYIRNRVAGKQRRFVPTRTSPYFEENVPIVFVILRQQQLLQIGLNLGQALPGQGDFCLGQLPHFGVGQHLDPRRQVVLGFPPGLVKRNHRAKFGVFA